MTIGNTDNSKKRHNAAVTRFYHRNRNKVLQYKKQFYYNRKFWINQPEKITEEDIQENQKIDELVWKYFKEL